MLSDRPNKSVKARRICFLREGQQRQSEIQSTSVHPSVVHLSSLLQIERKNQINRQFLELARSPSPFESHRPYNSQAAIRLNKQPLTLLSFYKRDIQTSQRLKKRRESGDQIFLSELTDQDCCFCTPREPPIPPLEKELGRSKRKNYIMRKLEFKSFLRAQSIKQNEITQPPPLAQEVIYENQKIKNCQESVIAGSRSHHHSNRRRIDFSTSQRQTDRISPPS